MFIIFINLTIFRVVRPRDDWMEVRRQPQFSSEDDIDEEEGLSEDEELAMYNSQRNYDRV